MFPCFPIVPVLFLIEPFSPIGVSPIVLPLFFHFVSCHMCLDSCFCSLAIDHLDFIPWDFSSQCEWKFSPLSSDHCCLFRCDFNGAFSCCRLRFASTFLCLCLVISCFGGEVIYLCVVTLFFSREVVRLCLAALCFCCEVVRLCLAALCFCREVVRPCLAAFCFRRGVVCVVIIISCIVIVSASIFSFSVSVRLICFIILSLSFASDSANRRLFSILISLSSHSILINFRHSSSNCSLRALMKFLNSITA